MTPRDAFDDALDAAIDAVVRGASPEQALASAPRNAGELRGLVQTAELLKTPPAVPRPVQTMSNYAVLKAAVERAQITRAQMIPRDPEPARAWWQRPLRFASLSVPAGVVAAFALAGAAGAAAGVATTNVGHDIADAVRPSFVGDLVGGGHDSTPNSSDAPGNSGAPVAPGGLESPGGSGEAPGAVNRPQFVEISGNVSNVRGNVFTLTGEDGEWQVQIDANTIVTGDVWEGATATAAGDVTADKNLHAWALTVTGGTPPVEPGNKPEVPPGLGEGGDAPGLDDPAAGADGTTPPAPESTPRPGEQGNENGNGPATPPGLSSKTPKPNNDEQDEE